MGSVNGCIQIEILDSGLLQTRVNGSLAPLVSHRSGWDLGGQEELGALEAGVLDGAAAAFFIAVHDSRVDLALI